jgi:hypothetical protein
MLNRGPAIHNFGPERLACRPAGLQAAAITAMVIAIHYSADCKNDSGGFLGIDKNT